jgi:hypothetical protein
LGFERLRLPHFLDNWLTDGGKVVSLMCQLLFTSEEESWDSFLLRGSVNPRAIVWREGLGLNQLHYCIYLALLTAVNEKNEGYEDLIVQS